MMLGSRLWLTAALIAGLAVLSGGAQAADTTTPAYLDTSLPPQVRAADLVHRMTLQEKVSQLVNGARAIPRLGVPSYNWWSEALHGVAVNGTTEFPEPVGLGATFDAPGVHEMAPTSASRDGSFMGRRCGPAARPSFTASISGRPTSISSVTPAGGEVRRHTARTRSSPRGWL